MKKLLWTACIVVSAAHAAAQGIEVRGEAYARPTVSGQTQGGAFLTLYNGSDADNVLLSASVPSDVAGKVELHTHVHDKGVMRMREVKGGITVPAKGTAELKPGGLHVMLLDLKQALTAGKTFPLTLKFKNGADKTVTVGIRAMTDTAPKHKHHHHGSGHHHHHHHH